MFQAKAPAPDEFWDEHGERFADEDNDQGFDVAKDPDAKYVDKVDDDFDIEESSADSEQVEEEKAPKAKQVYKDPRKKQQAVVKVQGEAPVEKKAKRVYKKKTTTVPSTDRVVRESTKQKTEIMNELVSSAMKKPRRKNKKRVVRTLTQKEILAEAKKTEKLNTESLNEIKAWEEEEKKRRKKKGPDITGPRVIYHSVGSKTVITFKDCDGGLLPNYFKGFDGKTNLVPLLVPSAQIKQELVSRVQDTTTTAAPKMQSPQMPLFQMQKEIPVPQLPSKKDSGGVRKKTAAQQDKLKNDADFLFTPPVEKKRKTDKKTVSVKKTYYTKKKSDTKKQKQKDFDKEDFNPPSVESASMSGSGSTRSGRKVKNKYRDDDEFFF